MPESDVRFTPESGQRPHGIYEYTPQFCGSRSYARKKGEVEREP